MLCKRQAIPDGATHRHVLVTYLTVLLVIPGTLQAANVNRTWTGNAGAPGNWSDPGNWDALPDENDNLYFYDSAQTLTTNDRGDDFGVRKFEFYDPAPAYTIAGDRIALQSTGFFNYSAATQTVDAAISGSAFRAINGPVVLNGLISGTAGLTAIGDHAVTITHNGNTFSGQLNVQTVVNIATIKNNTEPRSFHIRAVESMLADQA